MIITPSIPIRIFLIAILIVCIFDCRIQANTFPGYYTFELQAEDGYSWDGKKIIVVGPYWFDSQRNAWNWVRIKHVKQINLKHWRPKYD